jgi:hypothetical protein
MAVYAGAMSEHPTRRSVSLPQRVARRVSALAKSEKASENRVLVELIESGLEAREREKARFFELAERLAQAKGVAERNELKAELARMTFGE